MTRYTREDAKFIVGVVVACALLVALFGCASDGKPHPCDAEAIACLMAGGDWQSGEGCGECVYPTEKEFCEQRCSPIPCSDPEGDGAWECDWSDEPCPDATRRKSKDCDDPKGRQ